MFPPTSLMDGFSPLVVLFWSQLDYARSILVAAAADHSCGGLLYRSRGVATMLLTTSVLLFYCLILHATMPSSSPSLALLRLISIPILFAALFPITFDATKFTLGNDFRDIAIPSMTWLPIAEILRLGLVSIWDTPEQKAPRWIVPHDQAHKWQGATRLTLPSHKATDDTPSISLPSSSSTSFVPTVWYVLPHPPARSLRRILWAVDNMTIRRPGTSWIFPREKRAMEWALPKLVATGRIYQDAAGLERSLGDEEPSDGGKRDAGNGSITPEEAHSSITTTSPSPLSHRKSAQARRREAPVWFGQYEQGLGGCLAQLAALYAFVKYVRFLDLPLHPVPSRAQDFFTAVPLWDQYILTFGLGALVAFTAAPGELVLNSFLLYVLKFPVTAVAPSFQRPLSASGPKDFWGRRWHQWLRRDFSALARLFPGARDYPGIAAVGTFSLSAVEHSLVFGRFKPTPPSVWHVPILALLTMPIHTFFLCQAALIFLEDRLLGPHCPGQEEGFARKTARSALLWTGLLTSGRYVTAYMYQLGIFHPSEFFNWSQCTTLPRETWEDLTGNR